jgi:hypothetical protein
MVRATGGRLVEAAQKVGAIRDEVKIGDVLTLASAISCTGEPTGKGSDLSDRLLTVAIDELRRPAGDALVGIHRVRQSRYDLGTVRGRIELQGGGSPDA